MKTIRQIGLLAAVALLAFGLAVACSNGSTDEEVEAQSHVFTGTTAAGQDVEITFSNVALAKARAAGPFQNGFYSIKIDGDEKSKGRTRLDSQKDITFIPDNGDPEFHGELLNGLLEVSGTVGGVALIVRTTTEGSGTTPGGVGGGVGGGTGGGNRGPGPDPGDLTSPVLSLGSAVRTSDTTATITYTSDKAGRGFYLVSNTSSVSIADVTNGTEFGAVIAGVNTQNVTGLPSGPIQIHVVVRSAAGRNSQILSINAGAYVASLTPEDVDITTPIVAGANGEFQVIETGETKTFADSDSIIIDGSTFSGGLVGGHEDATGSITIPDYFWDGDVYIPITGLADDAFKENTDITNVTLGSNITSIGADAFNGCEALTDITIPDSVTTIGDGAFAGSGLTSITIPDSVTTIGDGAFAGCTDLEEATIGDGVTTISADAFNGCEALTDITIPDSVTTIGDRAFAGSGLTSITIPASVTTGHIEVFKGCDDLASVTFAPDSTLTSIGGGMFQECTNLESITIPNSVTTIGDSAFSGCTALETVTVGNAVTSIGNSAFQGCSALPSVTLGNAVTSIGNSAFQGCSALEEIEIPATITLIGSSAFSGTVTSGSRVITILATTPPEIQTNDFPPFPRNTIGLTIKVPKGEEVDGVMVDYVALYKTAWGGIYNFTSNELKIEEVD